MEQEQKCPRVRLKLRTVIENVFGRLGFVVASKPWHVIFSSLFVVLISCIGLIRFSQEKDPLKLWVDQSSSFIRDTHWLVNTFADGYRTQHVLITADNVLEAQVLQKIGQINDKILAITSETEEGAPLKWDDVCFKVPIIPIKLHLKKRDISENHIQNNNSKILRTMRSLDPSASISPSIYCIIVNSFQEGCLQYSLADIWKYKIETLEYLSTDEILLRLNSTKQSPMLGHPMNYVTFLGGIEKNASGYIVSAKAILSTWFLHINFTSLNMKQIGNDAGTENWATYENLKWEKNFLNIMESISQQSSNMSIYYEAGRSYGDISSGAMFQDIDKLIIGIVLMCMYVHVVISKWNWVHQRFIVGSMGLLGIGISFFMTVSLCSVLGFSYGPVHTSLPFLLMGLGIDDMFVLLACWEKVSSLGDTSIPHRVSLMLKQAGMAITVTTITDMAAFLVGSFTVLPSLQSFCFYAATGVFVIYIFTVTFLVACFALDQNRLENNYNGLVPCYKHKHYVQNECSQFNYMEKIITFMYSEVILTKFGKIMVILSTICMTSISIKYALLLEQRFDPFWFIPEDTHLFQYVQKRREYFPQIGYEAAIYIGQVNYSAEFHKIVKLEQKLHEQKVINNIDSWVQPYFEYVRANFYTDIKKDLISEDKWNMFLSKYLFSASGAKHRAKFKFVGDLTCGEPAPVIKVSSINFHFRRFNNSNLSIAAMNQINKLAHNINFTTGDKFCTVWGKMFGSWSTDEIIGVEVKRNLLLALGCVMACTLFFICNLNVCFWIFSCVLLTLVNVCGFMCMWGLTIDLVSCIALQLSVGLCIDYATHIGHSFLLMKGANRTEKAVNVMTHIGAAVINGGGSTLLALSMLSFSKAYTFKAFFKIFFLIISFGLYHGIIFLPVMLSIVGPIHNKGETKHREDAMTDTMLPANDNINPINID